MQEYLSSTYELDIQKQSFATYRLTSSQILPVPQEKAFAFFEDPKNLCDITPVWLDFCLLDQESNTGVYENAEFDYTIKFLGFNMTWRSRIIDYHPPYKFTDIQLKGPYKSWVHVHTLEEVPEGTLMRDEVTYRLNMPAFLFHDVLIRKKLMDIFRYRAVKIAAWADKMN